MRTQRQSRRRRNGRRSSLCDGQIIQNLKDSVDLRTIWGDGKILCPWHDDHNPSMHVYRDHAHCFSSICGITVDGIKMAQQMCDMDFTEAVEFLRQYKGKRGSSFTKEKAQPLAWQVAAEYYKAMYDRRKGGREGRQWLKARGIRGDISVALRLGWTGRAISIPHISGGKVWNIKYRVLPEYLMDREPKYNSHKHQPFPSPYPMDYLNRTFPTTNVLFLTEGEFDTILLLQCGLASLAIGGVSHALNKWRNHLHGKILLVAFDMDKAGRHAADALFKKSGALGMSPLDKLEITGYRLVWPSTWGTDITEARRKLIPLLRRQYEKAII